MAEHKTFSNVLSFIFFLQSGELWKKRELLHHGFIRKKMRYREWGIYLAEEEGKLRCEGFCT